MQRQRPAAGRFGLWLGHFGGEDGKGNGRAFHIHLGQNAGVNFAKNRQPLFRAQTQHAMAAGVEPRRAIAQNLHFFGRPDGGQQRLGISLGIEHIYRAGAGMHVFWPGAAHQ